MTTSAWSTQQLAEFLEIFSAIDRGPMLEVALDRVAESLDVEAAAYLAGPEVLSSRGFRPGRIPTAELVALGPTAPAVVDLPDLGRCQVMTAGVDRSPATHLVVARRQPGFDREEKMLLRSMGRALGLALANRELVAQLAERQDLSSKLFRIQQSISHRAPLQDVLDAVTEGASELLRAPIVGVQVNPMEPDGQRSSSMAGVDDRQHAMFASVPIDVGFSGRAFTENRLVITDDYQREPRRVDAQGEFRTHAAMAAPVHRDGDPVGVISVAALDPARRFTGPEQEVLLAFAQHVSLALNDASAVHQMRESLVGATYQASHDSLTNLPNRAAVLDALDASLGTASADHPVALLFVDVDRFKAINDVLGHAVGDLVLIEIANRLQSAVRTGDLVARLAGDEFVVVAPGVSVADAEELALRINDAVGRPLDVGYRDIVLTVSVGVAVASCPMAGDDLLADADVAMYRAKQRGRSRVVHFDQQMRVEAQHRSELERDLTRALRDGGQLEVHYQSTVQLATGRVEGFEALVRWRHPTKGLLGAHEFVPLAEETGQVSGIDRFVLREATRQLAQWQAMDPSLAGLSMAVNLSARQFGDPELVALVEQAVLNARIPSSTLWLEITETTVMGETGAPLAILQALRALGVRLSIDDFGTGYSSLVYLKRFPVDALKIDRSFIAGLLDHHDDRAIVVAVIRLAEALGLAAVAEGVETIAQADWLRAQGCSTAQGYLFARPLPPAQCEARLRAQLVEGTRQPVRPAS
jgi:diguanylate cyclase (GGDEF)-like protein